MSISAGLGKEGAVNAECRWFHIYFDKVSVFKISFCWSFSNELSCVIGHSCGLVSLLGKILLSQSELFPVLEYAKELRFPFLCLNRYSNPWLKNQNIMKNIHWEVLFPHLLPHPAPPTLLACCNISVSLPIMRPYPWPGMCELYMHRVGTHHRVHEDGYLMGHGILTSHMESLDSSLSSTPDSILLLLLHTPGGSGDGEATGALPSTETRIGCLAPSLTVLGTWGMSQWMEALFLSLSISFK